MIYFEHPGDQLDRCLAALKVLTCALESCDNEGFASTCQTIQWGIEDAFERIEAKHKAEREGFAYLSLSEREKLIERLKATAA